jgi:hypothetical protein
MQAPIHLSSKEQTRFDSFHPQSTLAKSLEMRSFRQAISFFSQAALINISELQQPKPTALQPHGTLSLHHCDDIQYYGQIHGSSTTSLGSSPGRRVQSQASIDPSFRLRRTKRMRE